MRRLYIALLTMLLATALRAQQVYFVDGYHGGIYGHYPVEWKTAFIVEQLNLHPDWRIGLEIEPETWDTVRLRTPEDYARFELKATSGQVEFTNPAYGQPYLYNVSGESVIRQFQLGMRKIREHFPGVEFLTYSAEEPCFTSCLPQVLRSLGFRYAVLKCPDTCWGGYTSAYGGELVNWTGPDGTAILAVPRYACEALEENSTWQTAAWDNGDDYLEACARAGIARPVGMCYQDAGWRNGPWLSSGEKVKNGSRYTRWRDYFEEVTEGRTDDNWLFTQEDVRPCLMWGSQTLQRIARDVREAENKVAGAEKLAAMACMDNGYQPRQQDLEEAWRTLSLAQHHDAWIVPYNGLKGYGTWEDAVRIWTGRTDSLSDGVAREAAQACLAPATASSEDSHCLTVYNTTGRRREETVSVDLPGQYRGWTAEVRDWRGRRVDSQTEPDGRLFFTASAPAFGYAAYTISKTGARAVKERAERPRRGGRYILEDDQYRITIDLDNGGAVTGLVAKREGMKEYVDPDSPYRLGELRGFFYGEGRFRSSAESPAELWVIRDNGWQKQVSVTGEIASHPFTKVITLTRGRRAIDVSLRIDWRENTGIGEYREERWREDRRAFCDDAYKLNLLLPLALDSPSLYKNAPFDVCLSREDSTSYKRWSEIKHNVVLNWVDLTEGAKGHGMALLTDHTTSYTRNGDGPLGLTVQYSGQGLWGMDYRITRPTEMRYALVPHRGAWDEAAIQSESVRWNEPLRLCLHDGPAAEPRSFVDLEGTGYELSAAIAHDGLLTLRLFNAEGDGRPRTVSLGAPVEDVEEIDLDGNTLASPEVRTRRGRTLLTVEMPRFGLKTYRLRLR